LDVNHIEFSLLEVVRKLLERNIKTRDRTRPQIYAKRIEQLTECKKSVSVLSMTLQMNQQAKRVARTRQAAMLQGLADAREQEEKMQKQLKGQLDDLRRSRPQVDEEITLVESKLQQATADGEYEVGQLQASLDEANKRIDYYKRHIDDTRREGEQLRERAGAELATLGEELSRARRARDSAAALAEATRSNLGNFSGALRTIDGEIAGGMEPRQRLVHVSPADLAAIARRELPAIALRQPSQPKTPRLAAAGAAALTPRACWK
jgi:chromosome segregation ATPase